MSGENNVLSFAPKGQKVTEDQPKFIFPEIYRLEGYAEIPPDKRSKGIVKLPKQLRRPPSYVLSDASPHGYLKPTWTPITRLDPKLDTGWVVVRHHHDDSHLEGFLDNQIDRYFDCEDVYATSQVLSSDLGTFTLTHRFKARGAPDHLLILIFSPGNDKQYTLQERIERPNQYTICHPDGSITYDKHLLYPFIKDPQ